MNTWDMQGFHGPSGQQGQVVAAILEQLHLLLSTMVCGGEKDEVL